MKTILLVEDNPGDQKLFEEFIKEEKIDCELIIAASANDSINMIFRHKPDVIIMDINMPGLPGDDFVFLLRGNSATKHIPIIFLTGLQDKIISSPDGISIEGKIFPLLSKPADPQQLKKVILKFIGQ
jgi:CheY-like chemotaxis protein